jgi:glutamate transport system substrate-binding protein
VRSGIRASLALACAVSLCGMASLAACGGRQQAAQPSRPVCGHIDYRIYPQGSTVDRLNRVGLLRVGIKDDTPGMGYRDPVTGEVSGLDIEIAKIVACRLGVPESNIEWVPVPTKDREDMIIKGAVDFITATYAITFERMEKVSFAGPYYQDYQRIMLRNDQPSIASLKSAHGMRVCAAKGSVSLKNITAYTGYGVVPVAVANYSDCVRLLLEGKIEAVSTQAAILTGQLGLHPGELKIVGDPFDYVAYGIGLKRRDATFRRFLNNVLQQAIDDGSWREAYDKTLGRIDVGTPIPPTIVRY